MTFFIDLGWQTSNYFPNFKLNPKKVSTFNYYNGEISIIFLLNFLHSATRKNISISRYFKFEYIAGKACSNRYINKFLFYICLEYVLFYVSLVCFFISFHNVITFNLIYQLKSVIRYTMLLST